MKYSILVIVMLAGCVSSSSIYTEDGTAGHAISCNGALFNWNYCQAKAGKLCGEKGYKTYERLDDANHVRTMVIACN